MKPHILEAPANKRQFLQGLALLMGAGASAQFTSTKVLANALSFQKDTNKANDLKLFTQSQMLCLHDICDSVLPQTDTPSAAQLGVHQFIDHQLTTCFTKSQQQQAIHIIDKIEHVAKRQHKKTFVELNREQQTALLEQLEAQKMDFNKQDTEDFALLKSLIVYGYFTTEIGATHVLAYQAVPGGFKGSIPYASVGKSYGSLAYY